MITKIIALDWHATKCFQKEILLIPFVAFGSGCLLSPLLTIPMCVFLCMFISINTFSAEEKGSLNNLYLTLPVKRSTIIAGRYCSLLLTMLCGIIMGIPLMFLADISSPNNFRFFVDGPTYVTAVSPNPVYIIATGVSLVYLIHALVSLYMFPMLFRLGYHKAKIWGYYVPWGLFVLFLIFYFAILFPLQRIEHTNDIIIYISKFVSDNLLLLNGGIVILATALLLVSYMISVKIYSKREF